MRGVSMAIIAATLLFGVWFMSMVFVIAGGR